VVTVRCWTDDGAPADATTFGVLFNNSKVLPSTQYAAFWQGDGAFTGTAIPSATYVMNVAPRLTHPSRGHYLVEYLGAANNPFPLVTAWGTTPRVCNIVDWYTARSTISPHHAGRFVDVACFDFAGKPLDSGFSFLMSSLSPLGVDGPTGGRLYASGVSASPVTPAADNVNNRSGSVQATNSYRTINATAEEISVPGYPGAFDLLDTVDTLEAVGDDGARCYAENPPTRLNGSARLLAECFSPSGQQLAHAVHGGIWDH
ncbi:MAG: hypothetical protein WCC60_23375, partial [Ilumatobacteraceae bacterium]